MYPPELMFSLLLDSWDKCSRELFRAFLAANSRVTRWIISSDYCLRDNSRANDCYAFTIIPFEDDFVAIKARMQAGLPKDIKRSRYLTQAGVDLLTDPRLFHLLIVVPKDRDIFNNGPDSNPLEISREVARITLDRAKEMERGENTLRPLKKMVEEARAKNFNFDLYGDLLLLGFFFPFISLLIARERKPESLEWLSDRDSMTTWGGGYVWNNSTESFVGLGQLLGIDVEDTRVQIGVPAAQSGPMWFDEMIRPPDFLAGTMAAWDTIKGTLPEGKKSLVFAQVLQHVIAESSNAVVLRIDIGGDGLQWRRLAIERQPDLEIVPLGPLAEPAKAQPGDSS